jgi:hypothetical protein
MVSRLRRRLDKLRLTLAILLLGFAINGTFETYTYINHSYPLPYAPSVFIIGPFVTLAGLLTLWIGRSDWDQPLSRRFRLAQEAFGLNVLALVLAITPVVWYGLWSDASIPSWVYGGFGAAIVVSLLFNFAIYVLVAYGLTANFGKALLLIAFGWASIVSIWTGRALAQELGTIVQIVQDRSLDFRPVSASISGIESYFALTYFMLMIAYLDAYHRSHLRTRKSS